MPTILDIELLRSFHTVVRLGRFRAAAEQLHKSPAAISAHIHRLESLCGGRLLARDNQSVSLTPLGETLLARSAALLDGHDRLVDELLAPPLEGLIRLGVPDEYAVHLLREVIPHFNATHPRVRLEIVTAPSLTLRRQLRSGRLDMAVSVEAAHARTTSPAPRCLTHTTPIWAVGAALGDTVCEPLPLALHADQCPYREAMLATLQQAKIEWREVLTSPSCQAIEACVEAGLAITLLDRTRLTPRMVEFDRLPSMPTFRVILERAPEQTSPALSALEETIARYFRL
ncbi:LysR family transcriptional regulator [Halotalea alkalilenta]|uniref:LysR family transcriptional regulator n=1 Tax=Halotalea alkalilenta TaxID=376489 RepID=UPI0004802ABA|nr:LysR family transcriptional regulator [Halotalea alkalilenta]